MLPIIDTHQHLWDLSHFDLPWLGGDGPLFHSFLMSDYLREAQGLNVVKTVYMEVDVAPEQQAQEAEYVTRLCGSDDNPLAGAVIGGDVSSDGFAAWMDSFTGNRFIKGVRKPLPPTALDSGEASPFVRGVRLLGSRGLRFDLIMGGEHLAVGAKLAAMCPETRFVLDHCGNPEIQAADQSQWKRDITALARNPNVICKISGIIARAENWTPELLAPFVHHCAEAFGPDRIIFASDWPVCTLTATLRQWIETLQEIVSDWGEEDRRKLFHDNALKFYALE